VFRGLNPDRAKDLRDRRRRYERRSRSIRYGTVQAGSWRHLLQAQWRALAGLRRPGGLLLVITAAGAACTATAGLGIVGAGQLVTALVTVPAVIVLVGLTTWVHERLRAGRHGGGTALVSPPARPARRAPQES
jgi:hypothetical protein